MLEIPESRTVSKQAADTLVGRTISKVTNATSPHKFAWYYGDPLSYAALLTGLTIEATRGHGMFVDILCSNGACITVGDGTNLRYYEPFEQLPEKHQLLIELDDRSHIAFTVAMYGGIWAYKGTFDNPYYQRSLHSISPLDEAFNPPYFDSIIDGVSKNISAKALLATEQRIPGLGNGVLQDILFNAGIHPKRKKATISDFEKGELFHSLKVTLENMTEKGGRDTEKDFYGKAGGYKTILSKNTLAHPCPTCGGSIKKEAYLGGTIYFCPTCQRI